jgi:hypothetical protein
MRLEDAGGDDDDDVSVGDQSGDGGGVGGVDEAEAEAVDVENEAVYVAAVMDTAVGAPLMHYEIVDANIVLPVGGDAYDDVPELTIQCGLLLGSDLINAPIAKSSHCQ